MKTISRLKKRSVLLFVILEITMLLMPLPFVHVAWDYFGQPKDYGAIVLFLLAYSGYIAFADAFLTIGERIWNWVNRKPEGNPEPTPLTSQPLPPIRALHSLPSPLPDFTGRANEIIWLLRDLRRGAHVAIGGLTGMGGLGKTALALAAAHLLSKEYSDAQIYLQLRGTTTAPLSPREAMTQVIHAFEPTADLNKATDTEIAGLYRSLLEGKSALLLLDNAADAD